MSFSIRFVDEVEEDIFSAYLWYEKQSSGLGETFLSEIYSKLDPQRFFPRMYQLVFLDCRRILSGRFPYAIYYRIRGDFVVVYGVFHTRKDPAEIIKSMLGR